MIAVIKIGGHQALVKAGEKLEVDKIDAKIGDRITFQTLLISDTDGNNFNIGNPFLKEKVSGKILEHKKGQKITVFKMKPRKRYHRTQGHRQDYTIIEITKISASASDKKETKKAIAKKTVKKAVVKKTAVASKKIAKKSK